MFLLVVCFFFCNDCGRRAANVPRFAAVSRLRRLCAGLVSCSASIASFRTDHFLSKLTALSPALFVTDSAAADWWRLGVLLYEISVGIPPFRSKAENREEDIAKQIADFTPDKVNCADPRCFVCAASSFAMLTTRWLVVDSCVTFRVLPVARFWVLCFVASFRRSSSSPMFARHLQLRFPPFVQGSLRSFIQALMTPDVKKRLGCGGTDAEVIVRTSL